MKFIFGFVDDDGIDLFESEGVLFDDFFDMFFIVDFDSEEEK